jgi:hypothetical protein
MAGFWRRCHLLRAARKEARRLVRTPKAEIYSVAAPHLIACAIDALISECPLFEHCLEQTPKPGASSPPCVSLMPSRS